MGGPATTKEVCSEHQDFRDDIKQIRWLQETINKRLDDQDERMKEGDELFKKIDKFMVEKEVTNGHTAKDMDEFKETEGKIEDRVINLEKNSATKNELKNLEDKLPSKTLIYINTLILGLFILAVIFDAARNAPIMKILGL